MSDLCKKGSESDVSSDSSWTLLDNGNQEKCEPVAKKIVSEVKNNETDGLKAASDTRLQENIDTDFVSVRESDVGAADIDSINSSSSQESLTEDESYASKQGCATLDEFLRERQLIHDYEYDDRVEKWENLLAKRNKRKYKRDKTDVVSALKVMGAILSIAGLSFACLLLPQTSSPFTEVGGKNNLKSPYQNAQIDTPVIPPDLIPEKYLKESLNKDQNNNNNDVNIMKMPEENKALANVLARHKHDASPEVNPKASPYKASGPKTLEEHKRKCPMHRHIHRGPNCKKVLQDPIQSKKSKLSKPEVFARNERSLLDELKEVGESISKKLFSLPMFKCDDFKKDPNMENPKPNVSEKKTVLLNAAGQLKKDIQAKIKLIKKKAHVKRCRKLLRFHKMNPNMTFSKSAFDICKPAKAVEKPAKVIYSVEEKKETKELFKELPFVNRRIPKTKSEKLDRVKKSTNITNAQGSSESMFEFLLELQKVKTKKQELLNSLNIKTRKQFVKEEKESRNLDKFYLANNYEKAVPDPRIKEQLLFCLSYLHSRKRDFAALISKMDVNEIIINSPKYNWFLEKLFQLEDEIVKYFQNKCNFVNKNNPEQAFTMSRPNFEIAAIVDLLLVRHKAKPKKDVATDRYVVPIGSSLKLSNSSVTNKSGINWPVFVNAKNRSLLNASNNDLKNNTDHNPKNSNKALVKARLSGLSVQSFSTSNYTTNEPKEAESKISKEKLEVLKTWKEKYEQLKMFWKSRQEYYDKRVEICEMIKEIIPPETKTETPSSSSNKNQGIEILDNLIQKVITKKDICNSGNDTIIKASSDLIDNVFKDIKLVFKQSERNEQVAENCKILSERKDLYDKLFDKKGKQIQKMDEKLWNNVKYPKVILRDVCSKQDPAKAYREKIAKKLP